MTTAPESAKSPLDALIERAVISGVSLDAEGNIVQISQARHAFSFIGQTALPNLGVGQNYLKHLASGASSSPAFLRGLRALLSGEIDVCSTLHHWNRASKLWCLTIAIALPDKVAGGAILLEVDVSHLMHHLDDPSALMLGTGPAVIDPSVQVIVAAVKDAICQSLRGPQAQSGNCTANPREERLLQSLTVNQLALLKHLARGAANSEIAVAQNISVGTAKRQMSALIKKLGLANRTQAALLAARNGLAGDLL